jgi:hypothetical protein
MTDVFLIEPGHGADFEGRAEVAAIPGGDHVLAIRIDSGPEHKDDVVEDGIDLRVALGRDKRVGELDGVLSAGDFVGVESAVDVDDDL